MKKGGRGHRRERGKMGEREAGHNQMTMIIRDTMVTMITQRKEKEECREKGWCATTWWRRNHQKGGEREEKGKQKTVTYGGKKGGRKRVAREYGSMVTDHDRYFERCLMDAVIDNIALRSYGLEEGELIALGLLESYRGDRSVQG